MEEIKSEAIVRKINNFAHFLDIIGLQNGKELHSHNISRDCGLPVTTIENYIQVLKDMLIGFEIMRFLKTRTRKAITKSKFYFFDVRVANKLVKRRRSI